MEQSYENSKEETINLKNPLDKAKAILNKMVNRQSHLQDTFDKMVKKEDE